jgi:hypothetical protein
MEIAVRGAATEASPVFNFYSGRSNCNNNRPVFLSVELRIFFKVEPFKVLKSVQLKSCDAYSKQVEGAEVGTRT